jgi:signal transduction histidine kinase
VAQRFDLLPKVRAVVELMATARSRGDFIEGILDELVDAGFERARYYEAAKDIVRNEEVLVLTTTAPRNATGPRLGFRVDYSSSTIAREEAGLAPVVAQATGALGDDAAWVAELDLVDRTWVEVPVTAGGTVVGVIAADWHGDCSDLDTSACEVLRAIGAHVGAHLGLKPITVLDRYRRDTAPHDSPEQLVRESADRLAELLDVAVAAVFEFSWPHQSLKKIHQRLSPALEENAELLGELPEHYGVREYLTGRAWDESQWRHLVSFESLEDAGAPLIAPESREWHTRLLGETKSVMYAVVGALDRRYLLRFINRANRPELPFLVEAALLDALIPDLRFEVDGAIATQRSRSLEEMAVLTAGISDPRELVRKVADALEAECVDHFAVVCHQSEAAQFGFTFLSGPRFADAALEQSAEWENDPLYASAVHGQRSVLRLSEHRHGPPNTLGAVLHSRGFKSVLTLPLSTGQTRGVFFVPMDATVSRSSAKALKLPPNCTFGTVSLLHAYSHLIGNAVETLHSQEKSDGARRALGFLGHELRVPLAGMGSAAEQAMNVAKRSIEAIDSEEHDSLLKDIREKERLFHQRQRVVDAALNLSNLVAKESEAGLQLHFAPASLSKVVDRAVQDVQYELRLDNERRQYDFDIAPSCRRLGSVTCDRDYLGHVLKNLIRNAVNYSLPRYRGEAMAIDLIGEPQEGWIAIKVRNWGLGIPENKRDLIFEPWVRGEVRDRKKAIRGMGLGLFLARRIMAAHEGNILVFSRFVLDDRTRAADLEGFETIFEVRVPRNLPTGTFTHRFVSDGQHTLVRSAE